MTPELKHLIDMLTYHADEEHHVERAVDAFMAAMTSLGVTLPVTRDEILAYALEEWQD